MKSFLSTCGGHTSEVSAVAAMPDGQRFLSGSYDSTVRVVLNGTREKLHATPRKGERLVALPDNSTRSPPRTT